MTRFTTVFAGIPGPNIAAPEYRPEEEVTVISF